MKTPHLFLWLYVLIPGTIMFAQTTDAPKNDTPPIIYILGRGERLHLENDRLKARPYKIYDDFYYINSQIISDEMKYRELWQSEMEGLRAVSKIQNKSGRLYFDGKKVKTNVLRVKTVFDAYYWNDGIFIIALTSQGGLFSLSRYEVGFIDLRAYKCKFVRLHEKTGRNLDFKFLVPISKTVENKNFDFDVELPEIVSMDDKINPTLMLTNNSKSPQVVPEFFFGGLGTRFFYDVYNESEEFVWPNPTDAWLPNRYEILKYGARIRRFYIYYSRDWEAVENTFTSLAAGQTRKTAITDFRRNNFPKLQKAYEIFPKPGLYRLKCHWEAFLSEDDKNEKNHFQSRDKFITVTKPWVNTTNEGFMFDVVAQDSVPFIGEWACRVSLTNVSQRPRPLPGYLINNPDVYCTYRVFDDRGVELHPSKPAGRFWYLEEVKGGFQARISNSSVFIPAAGGAEPLYQPYPSKDNEMVLVGPSEKREIGFSIFPRSLFPGPGRFRVVFCWHAFLNEDDKDELSMFTCEKWVEVTG